MHFVGSKEKKISTALRHISRNGITQLKNLNWYFKEPLLRVQRLW